VIALQITNLTIKQCSQIKPLILGLSLTIKKGEVLGIIGTSGSGKSVLINSLIDCLPSVFELSGSIKYDEETRISLVPQSVEALNPTTKIGDQLSQFDPHKKWYHSKNKMLINSALSQAQLPPVVADRYPYQLSGGMAKRVMSALAFIQDTDIIIADEPSCGVNDELAQPLFQHYASLAHGPKKKAIIMVSHDLKHVIDIADRILVLQSTANSDSLSIIEHTTPNEIKQGNSQFYSQALWCALPEHWSHHDSLN